MTLAKLARCMSNKALAQRLDRAARSGLGTKRVTPDEYVWLREAARRLRGGVPDGTPITREDATT